MENNQYDISNTDTIKEIIMKKTMIESELDS